MNKMEDQSAGHFWYFGYGSLVNDETRPRDTVARPYQLHGWRRRWGHRLHTLGHGHCSLTVRPCDSTSLLGVLVQSPLVHLPALDQREHGYDRLGLHCASTTLGEEAFIYRSQQDFYGWADEDYPILQSYVDVVVLGYLNNFGEQAAIDFIRTTEGWDRPIRQDREQPIYPRAVAFRAGQRAIVDRLLEQYAGYRPV